jgi:superfamily II DNA/RNA helicase
MTFTEIGVPPELIAALAKQKSEAPTPIQTVAYPVLQAGKEPI